MFKLKSHLLAVVFLVTYSTTFGSPEIKNGFLNAQNVDLNKERIALSGEWYFFENQLLMPSEIRHNGTGHTLFPKLWNEMRTPETGSGYATYALFILAPDSIKSLAIEIPQLYSSYSIWVDNSLIGSNGKVGRSASESIPQWLPQTLTFPNTGDTLKLVIQISNFDHFKGGAKEPLYFGSATLLSHKRSMVLAGGLIETITLFSISLLFFIIYFSKEKKKVVMYFALLCLTWAIRVGFSNQYLFIAYQPDFNWSLMVKIEYITLFLTMIWAILFLSRVFTKEENKIIKYLLVGSNILFISFTALAPPLYFTQWLPLYLSFCGFLLLYGGFIVLKAWINQRSGANYLTSSVLLGILIFTYDVFSYEGTFAYNAIIFSAANIVLFSLMGIALMLHINIIKTKNKSITKLTYNDLYK